MIDLKAWLHDRGIDPSTVDLPALERVIEGLPDDQAQTALDQVPTNIGGPQLRRAIVDAVQNTGGTPAQRKQQAQAQAQATTPVNPAAPKPKPTAAPGLGISPEQTAQGGTTEGLTPAPGDVVLGPATGLDVPPPADPNAPATAGTQLAHLKDFFPGTSQDEADYKATTGRSAQADYQDYIAAHADAGGGLGGMGRQVTPQNYPAWVKQQTQIAMGPAYTAVRTLQAWYQRTHGGVAMPAELEQSILQRVRTDPQLMQQLTSMAVETTQAVDTGATASSLQTGATTSAELQGSAIQQLLSGGAAMAQLFGPLFTNYDIAHPSVDAQKADFTAAMTATMQKDLGRAPNPGEIDHLFGMDSISQQAYIDQQNVHGTALTFGQYSTGQSRANSLWAKYWTGAPTKNDIQMISGMNDQQAQDWAFKQPSHDPRVNTGDYTGLHQAATQIASSLWNIPASPDLMNHVVKAATQKP